MQLFDLLSFQHVMGYIFGGLLFMVVFGLALSYAHFHTEDAGKRTSEIVGHFREGIQDRNAPYPLAIVLIVAGAVTWGFFYILLHGLLGVKI